MTTNTNGILTLFYYILDVLKCLKAVLIIFDCFQLLLLIGMGINGATDGLYLIIMMYIHKMQAVLKDMDNSSYQVAQII